MSEAPWGPGERVICLGTSPAMLFEGLRLARRGARVTFLDRAEAIGGGWRTRDLFGLTGLEVGAHLFENRRATLAALRSVLAEHELRVDEAGFGLAGTRRISLRAARALLYGGLTAKALARRDLPGLAHSGANLLASSNEWRLPLVYPRGGIAPLLARLHERLGRAGARFCFGFEVERIEWGSGEVAAVAPDGRVEPAERLVLSSRAHAPVAGLELHWRGLRDSRVDSLVLLLEEHAFAFEGYVELFSNPVIKRVRRLDVSDARRRRPAAVFQVRRMEGDAAATARAVLAEAARLGLVRGRPEPIALHHEVVAFRTLPAAALRRITAQGQGRIGTIATVDFSDPRPR